jgi:hypothetical protein
MAIEQNGEKFLTTVEVLEELKIASSITFQTIRTKHNIKSYRVIGQGRTKFYRASDIKGIPRVSPAKN